MIGNQWCNQGVMGGPLHPFLGEILFGGHFCLQNRGKIYEIERKRKKAREEGNRGNIWSVQGQYQRMKQ
tara:strand:- start:119 stop:325 length:207 start_codon:yes stop_codon:yes gene_type:complete